LTLLYLDTSALARLYTNEAHHEAVQLQRDTASGVVCHQLAYVELHSALAGRRRRKAMTETHYRQAIMAVEADWVQFAHVGLDDALLRAAAQLARTEQLRAYDAVHLTAAQALLPLGVQFMTFDVRLRQAATHVMPGSVWLPQP